MWAVRTDRYIVTRTEDSGVYSVVDFDTGNVYFSAQPDFFKVELDTVQATGNTRAPQQNKIIERYFDIKG